MPETNSKSYSVAIVGAGLSGLCLAQGLLGANVNVHVYERDATPHARRQGYRITVDKDGLSALKDCLPDQFFQVVLATASSTSEVGHFRFTNERLQDIFTLTFKPNPNDEVGLRPRQVDRQMLRAILLSGLEGRVHFGKHVVGIETDNDGSTLLFADGSKCYASVVVGADGVNSPIRHHLLPNCPPLDLNATAIYGRTQLRPDETLLPEQLEGTGVLALGTSPGDAFFFTTMLFQESPSVAFSHLPNKQPPPIETNYIMWAIICPQAHGISDSLSQEALHRIALDACQAYHPVLVHFVESADKASRVTLVGDAVHVMPPFGAYGGNTALKDAALLGQKLQAAIAQNKSLEDAIGEYQREMVEYAFAQVDKATSMMERLGMRNPIMRWVMLRVIPWIKRVIGSSLVLDE
ncbi:hypothetical protein BZG36_05491 [Bifiguratus adelaidae]|uniref:FAD-binding domain-containing protein n=1 Tax=Bifiguratus adelaidae TaxID=1938954 RepID=A0A261XV16_9FUNG|nr:hypothetical protein BZG36_05491 [Bifiguratus adelaidae]